MPATHRYVGEELPDPLELVTDGGRAAGQRTLHGNGHLEAVSRCHDSSAMLLHPVTVATFIRRVTATILIPHS